MTKDQLREALRGALDGWQAALNAHEDGKVEAIEPARVSLRAAAGRAGVPVQERPKRTPYRPAATSNYADPRPGANEQEGGKQE